MKFPVEFKAGPVVQEINADGTTFRKEPAIVWESAFVRELRHFHECIIAGTPSRTSVESARNDIALIIAIIKAYILRE